MTAAVVDMGEAELVTVVALVAAAGRSKGGARGRGGGAWGCGL